MTARCLIAYGECFYYRDNFNRAQQIFAECIPYAYHAEDLESICTAHMYVGIAHRIHGHLKEAEAEYMLGLKYATEAQSHEHMAKLNRSLGVLKYWVGDYRGAEAFLRTALVHLAHAPHLTTQLTVIYQLCSAVGEQGNFEQAINIGLDGLALAREHNRIRDMVDLLGNLAEYAIRTGKLDQALEWAQESLDGAERHAIPSGIAYAQAKIYEALVLQSASLSPDDDWFLPALPG